jgi:hypothetical protein
VAHVEELNGDGLIDAIAQLLVPIVYSCSKDRIGSLEGAHIKHLMK